MLIALFVDNENLVISFEVTGKTFDFSKDLYNGITEPREPSTFPYLTTEKIVPTI